MKSTFKTLFYLKKNEPKKNGHVVIMVRITVDGDQVQFSSKLDIHPDNWDTKAGRAVINKQSADKKENLRVSSLNKTLDEIRSAITMHYTRMMNVDGYALPEKIRNAFLGLEEKEKTLISYFTQHNEQYAKKVGKTATQKTYSRYELTKQRMIEFLQKEYKLSDIPVKEITVTHIENFYLYLRQECEVSNNTAMKFVQRF
ncbi:site-specific integrase, partial [Bacteroides stercoris]